MLSAKRRYGRVGEGRPFPLDRTDVDALNKDLFKAEEDIDKLKRQWMRVLGAVILLLVLLLLGWLAYGLWIGLYNNQQDGNINDVRNNVTVIQQNIMQLILEFHGETTVLQSGNVSWVLSDPVGTGLTPVCVDPTRYVSQDGTPILSKYEVRNIRIGLLNFTVLVLFPPPVTLTYTTANGLSYAALNVCLIDFTPAVPALDLYNTNSGEAPTTNFFTAANVARISIDADCLADQTCQIRPYLQEWFSGTNAYTILKTQNFPDSGEYFVQWTMVATNLDGGFEIGTNITIIEPLQLLLLSS